MNLSTTLVYLVYLVYLVCFVFLVCLVKEEGLFSLSGLSRLSRLAAVRELPVSIERKEGTVKQSISFISFVSSCRFAAGLPESGFGHRDSLRR